MKTIENFVAELNEELYLLLNSSGIADENEWNYFTELITELHTDGFTIIQSDEFSEIANDIAFNKRLKRFQQLNELRLTKNEVIRKQNYELGATLSADERTLIDEISDIPKSTKTDCLFFIIVDDSTIGVKKFGNDFFDKYLLSRLRSVEAT